MRRDVRKDARKVQPYSSDPKIWSGGGEKDQLTLKLVTLAIHQI
jgi:hypothetical protein